MRQWAAVEASQRAYTGNTLADLAAKWRGLLEDPSNPLEFATKTRKEWLRMLKENPPSRLLRVFGHMPITSIEPFHIGEYLDKSKSPVAANREIGLLSRMFNWARRKGKMEENPCDGIERNKETGRDMYIEDADYVAIRDFCKDYSNENGHRPWQALAYAMDISYLTSFREGDIIRIQAGHYDADELKVTEGKTGWKARADMTPELAAVIEEARKTLRRRVSALFLITSRDGTPYTESGFKSAWQRMIRKAIELEVIKKADRFTFHDIRAKHATDKDEQGLNAQLALGHPDPKMTAKYIRHRKGRKIDTLRTDLIKGGER